MARRVIATAEVQVAADVGQAEAGLEGLSETFRQVGGMAERAARKAEAAFFQSARTIDQAFERAEDAVLDVALRLNQGNENARHMAGTFLTIAANISKAQQEGLSLQAATEQMLDLLRQASASANIFEEGLEDAANQARRLKDEADLLEVAVQSAAMRAEQLERAFRDVGRAIDLAMAGGLDQVNDDIRETIRRLSDMGGEFRDVGVIGERALNDIVQEARRVDANLEDAADAAMRLLYQLRQVEKTELDRLAREAQKATTELNQMGRAAERADRSVGGMGSVARRTSSDLRGMISLLGATGLGYAAASAARFGLEMTQQLEKSEAAFLGLTGSVEGAADMLERMVIFARETPYNLASVTEAAAQLLAVGDGFGVTATNIDKYLTSFGNAISITGGSEDQFIRIVRVLGQMSSTGKVLGQDMNQLAQNLPGYDVWQALADGAGTSVQELRRLQDLGQLDELLTGNEAVQILIEGMETIPGAVGAMERRMSTLGGAIEKFKETAQLAVSDGLIPFSEEAQDILSDRMMLRSVEDLSFAFGDLLSGALEDVRPELDDLAAAGENFLGALQTWTPVLRQVVDTLGDFLNYISPLVSGLGTATEAVLGFGNGIGKMALAAGAFAAGGPIGIGAGVLLGISGAMDFMGGKSEELASLQRLLAAAQDEVNTSMSAGEEVVYSESQQLAIDTAEQLKTVYPELVTAMTEYGVTVEDLRTSMLGLQDGTGTLTPELQRLQTGVEALAESGYKGSTEDSYFGATVIAQLEEYGDTVAATTSQAEEDQRQLQEVLAIAGVEEIKSLEDRRQAQLDYYDRTSKELDEYYKGMLDAQDGANRLWGELTEDQTDKLTDLLQEQADGYQEWEDSIDDSTSAAALSLSEVADEAENSVSRMIEAINQNTTDTIAWKDMIVNSAAILADVYDVPKDAAVDFMGVLGEMGPESAPALQAMLDNFMAGGGDLKAFFDAVTANSDAMSSSLVDDFQELTDSGPTIAEGIADGTLTIEELLAELPTAMEEAGIDFETAAAAIDIADDLSNVGDEGVAGLVNALSGAAAKARVRRAAAELASVVSTSSERTLEVYSPSRVMYRIGEYVVEGLVRGIQSMSSSASAVAAQTATLITGGIEWHFRTADKPKEAARAFAKDIGDAIVKELIAEQEAVADAAEALAEAAADRLADAWDRVSDRFTARDIREKIADAEADLAEARAELATATSLAGGGGASAIAAAEARLARAQEVLAAAEATDQAADLLADNALRDFSRATEDAVEALRKTQESEVTAIQARIDSATRNLDPVARAAAEADLAATNDRHEAEMTALERRRQDEEEALRTRLANENAVREAGVRAKQDELRAFEDALDDIVDAVKDAMVDLPKLRENVGDAQRDVEDAFFDQFEELLEDVSSVDRSLLKSIGTQAGLTTTEVDDLIKAALAAESTAAKAATADLGVDNMLKLLSSGLYTIGGYGALGIAAGLTSEQEAIARAMFDTVQRAITATLRNLEIRSPSRVTERLIGEPMALGIARGILGGEAAVSAAMRGLMDNVVNGASVPSASQLVGNGRNYGGQTTTAGHSGPLVTMPGAIIQDATDADLVAQRVVVALAATGIDV